MATPVYEIKTFNGAISDFEDKGPRGSFKFGYNLDVRKKDDTLSCNQTLIDEGITIQSTSPSQSPSSSKSPSASTSPSPSPSISPSSSLSNSPSQSPSISQSPSASKSPSASASPSASVSPSSSVSPSTSSSAGLTSVFSDLIIAFVKASDGKVYGFGKNGKIYKRNSDAYWIKVYDAHEPITGAEEKPSSGGKTYLVWAGYTTLHRKELPGLSNWNDVDVKGSVQGDSWPKTNLTYADWHTMANVGGDVMICNGPMLAMSAYDDSYTNEALDLIPGNIAKTVLERNGRAVVGTYKAADPTKGVNGSIDAEVPLAQVGDEGEIFFADFTSSLPAKVLPGGGKVNPYGVCNLIEPVEFFDWEQTALSWIDKQKVGNLAMFGVFNADDGYNGVYSYGRRDKNHSFILNLEYRLEVDEIGAICSINGVLLVSYKDGTTYGVKSVDANNKAIAGYYGLDFHAPVKKEINISQWKRVEVFMKPLPSGCSIEFWYKIDKTGDFVRAKTEAGDNSFSTTNGKKASFRINAEGQIFEPYIILNPYNNTTPEIRRVRVYFL